MHVLTLIGAVFMIVIGALYPMIAIYTLYGRLRAEPPATSVEVGVRLALVAVVPMAGIIGGLTILSADAGASSVLRAIASTAGLATLAGFLILGMLRARRVTR